MAATTPTRKRTPEMGVRHLDGCPAERIESYDASGPRGVMQVTRCIDCGEAKVTSIENEEAV